MIRIFNTSLSSPSDSPGGLTTELGQQTSPGRRGFGPKSSGHRSPGGGASILANKRLTLPFLALLAVLTAGLLFLLPGGLLQAQDDGTIEYAENGMDPVATYTGIDPEERLVYWSLLPVQTAADLNNDGDTDDAGEESGDNPSADVADFTISSDGVLTFRSPPNFEMAGDVGTNNEYEVVVVASDDARGAALAQNGDDIREMAYHKVTVTVTDVDEDGSVSLSGLQPQAGVAFTATLKDDDAADTQITAAKWKWEQSSSMDGPWTLISGQIAESYQPAKDVDGMYLRATATYDDEHGEDKTAMAISAHSVRAKPAGNNSIPVPTDANPTRKVKENSPLGTNVGKPVTAGDAGDILTYSFDTTADNDHAMFSIDRVTGQIMTKGKLNAEADVSGDRDTGTDGFQLQVTVTATDPWNDDSGGTRNFASVTVSITVENVNESPKMIVGPTRDSQDENEDTDLATGIQIPILAYAVTDVDAGDTIRWTLEGADKDALKITKDTTATTGATSSAMVMFKKSPNFEKPTDADMDNMYMVTVVATDKKKLTAMRDVVITVKNADDDGKITFSSVQPKVGIPFTATLTDEDGVVAETVKWQWYNGDPDANDNDEIDNDAIRIAKAKSDTYTPKRADLDPAITFHVWATYTDSIGSTSATNMADNPVVVNQENQPPAFKLNDKVITATTRMVAENTEANSEDDAAGASNSETDDIMASGDDRTKDPVMATDMSGTTNDTLTYTLGGRDETMFRVRSDTGRIEVGTGTKLDYEKKKSYMVTVTATDPSLVSATIDVTINVTDVNEPPEIAGEDDLTKEFRENLTSTIQTFRATDPERRPVYWSLKQNDNDYPDDEYFTISSSGALSFNEGRDFENQPTGITGNKYKVIIVASDDAPNIGTANTEAANPSERKFTVQVINVNETGSVTVNQRYPQVGVAVTATLMDGDATTAEIGNATWQWYRGATPVPGETGPSYSNPAESGSHKVEATYIAKGNTRTASKTISIRGTPTSNAEPTFPNANEARSVDEGKANANVGVPIVATDSDSGDGGKLTYTVSPDTHFSITNNGQLKTKVALDAETPPTLALSVTATDPSGTSGDNNPVTVTVTINNVNEAPMIIQGPTRASNWLETKAITEAVAVYTAGDPETTNATDLVWSLTGPDASDFNIGNQDDTVTAGTLTFKEKPDYEMPAASNNLYRVTVEVSDGKLKATRLMTVMVTDVEEEGKVTLSSVQPKVAIDLTASLKDSDGDVEKIEWQWARTSGRTEATADCPPGSPDTPWTDIDAAEMATYTPEKDDDLLQCLRATAKYTDRRGDGKTAMGVSANGVIDNTDNRAPEFKDQPSSLEIDENSNADDIVGIIRATDPNDDKLTYKLTGDAALFKIASADDDNTNDVDERGQITVKTADTLDYEDKKTYMVTVTATDPNGLSDSHDVTIKVTDMDEAPKIIVGGLVVTGTSDINYIENGMGMVATYSAAGPDAADATWSLSGADAGDLSISSAGVLTFMASPNYESPADANTDNIYMVMVNANDGTNVAMKTVSVRVTNEEEMGEVTLWAGSDALTMAPQVGDTITGAVMDPDVPVNVTAWQWSRTMTPDMMDSWMPISGATAAAYMVTAGDTGHYLRVMATYMDAVGTDTAMEYSPATMMVGAEVEEMTLLGRYDDGDDGWIQLDEARDAVGDYFVEPKGTVLSLEDARKVVGLYFEYKNSQQ